MGITFAPIEVRKEYLLGTFDEDTGMKQEDLPRSMRVTIYNTSASGRDFFMGNSWTVVGTAQLRLEGISLYATPSFFVPQVGDQPRSLALTLR